MENNVFDGMLDLFIRAINLVSILQVVFGVSSVYGIYSFFMNFFPKKIELSIGSFTIARKHFDVQNITNIVSCKFYDGGLVPNDVRKEILNLTCPKVKLLKKNVQ